MTKLKLNVHCEINEIIKFEMTFKIKTKLDTSKWTHQLQKKKKILKKKNFQYNFSKKIFEKILFSKKISKQNFKKNSKKKFFFQKNLLKKIFQKKIFSKKKFLQKKIFSKKFSAKKKISSKLKKKIEFVKLNFKMQQNICKNQIGTKKASFPRSPV